MKTPRPPLPFLAILLALATAAPAARAQLAVKAKVLHPMTGDLAPIQNGVVLCGADGKIEKIGPATTVTIPAGWKTLEVAVVMPGLIDARTTVGLSGILNWERRDQEQLEPSQPAQPELRAIDAYNGRDPLVKWVRDLGVTTVHTGHAPLSLISGQTMILKTNVASVTRPGDVLRPLAGVAASLGPASYAAKDKAAPGTRAKSVAMLRAEFIKAREYLAKVERGRADPEKAPDRDLHLEALGTVLRRETPLILTADRHQDIGAALRLRTEFGFQLVLDSAAEAYLLLEEIKAAQVPVLIHPTMARATGEKENLTFTLAAKLHAAGIPFAFQSGFEDYVPKTRVVLFEAGMAAAHGLPAAEALAACTIRGAQILGLEKRLGSLEPGKDADLALFDGDPLELTTHCLGVIIDGKVIESDKR